MTENAEGWVVLTESVAMPEGGLRWVTILGLGQRGGFRLFWRGASYVKRSNAEGTASVVREALEALQARPVDVGPDPERLAQMVAHRACLGAEHDPENGYIHGCCTVCGVPWPCVYAGPVPGVTT